ncbi:golgin subfamily A member 6-like protein 22 [Engraulis encrasicolus]|uniref:golgin subfamily A member 6-like protein 22 n=1 Tax=Engraulis encrasicolus TaxID=184585 RepID=UPI002FD2CF5C
MLGLGTPTCGAYQSLCELKVHDIPQLQRSMSLPLIFDGKVERSQHPSLAPSRSPSCQSIVTASLCTDAVPVVPVCTCRCYRKPISALYPTLGWAITPLDMDDRESEISIRERIKKHTDKEMLFLQEGSLRKALKHGRLKEMHEGRLAELIRERLEGHRVRAWRARYRWKWQVRQMWRTTWRQETRRRENERKREEKERKREEKERKREENERKKDEKEKRRQERKAAPSRWRRVLGVVCEVLTCCKRREEERDEGEQQQEEEER